MKNGLLILFFFASIGLFAQKDTTVAFKVFGNCEMCKMRIEKAALIKGVKSAGWDIDTKVFTLEYDPRVVSLQKVHRKIADAGHDTELEKAKDFVYKGLPDCCLYRDGNREELTHRDGEMADAEKEILGVVMEMDEKGNLKPLSGASIILSGSEQGTAANENGFFKLMPLKDEVTLEISYAGFLPQKVDVKAGQHLTIVLNSAKELQEVKIISGRKSSFISAASVIRTQIMTEKELFKAACCNLSESFETNPSVDVSYNDAVTGSKQIQLLGLSGNYLQLTVENLPGPRGIATSWGLNSVPGTWIESIQLTKGVGSVVNGFESIAGQVNVELKKPENSGRLYANTYINNMGKTDLNLNLSKKIGSKWSTALLLHDAFLSNTEVDFNKDGFRDLPTGNLFTFLNRWKFDNNKGVLAQFGFRLLDDNKVGGQTAFEESKHKLTTDYYGVGIKTKRHEAFAKMGYVFPEKRYKSIGLQLAAFRHHQDSYFGLSVYDATQKNFYANLIYQSILGNTNHKFRTGISFVTDDYNEKYKNNNYKRTENIPGAFFEYTYTGGDKLDIIAGIRGDHNSLFGFFATPRLHIKYQPVKGTTVRAGAGRGQRTANIFAENLSVFVSSRQVRIVNSASGKAYGLLPEIAWSEGIGIDQRFRLFSRNGNFSVDFFRTDFQNQVIADLDQTAREVSFYNLDGISYANSFQTELNYELLNKLEFRLAYRLFDVKTTYNNQLLERPLIAKHRGFANLAYEISGWKFDYTITYNGTKRIPYTGDNPVSYRMTERSPSYIIMNAQLSKTWGNKFPVDVYLGAENLTNYYQNLVILGSDEPFGQNFDASLIWGPVSGRMFYGGVRLLIN